MHFSCHMVCTMIDQNQNLFWPRLRPLITATFGQEWPWAASLMDALITQKHTLAWSLILHICRSIHRWSLLKPDQKFNCVDLDISVNGISRPVHGWNGDLTPPPVTSWEAERRRPPITFYKQCPQTNTGLIRCSAVTSMPTTGCNDWLAKQSNSRLPVFKGPQCSALIFNPGTKLHIFPTSQKAYAMSFSGHFPSWTTFQEHFLLFLLLLLLFLLTFSRGT